MVYQTIISSIFSADSDIKVELNESIKNFLSKEDLALSQSEGPPDEKRPRFDEGADKPLENKEHQLQNPGNAPQNTGNASRITETPQGNAVNIVSLPVAPTVQVPTTLAGAPASNTISVIQTGATNITSTLLSSLKKEKYINFGLPQRLTTSVQSILGAPPTASQIPDVGATSTVGIPSTPSTSGLTSFLAQSPFGNVSSAELKDLPPKILERINFFSQDNRQSTSSRDKSSDLLDDRGGNICSFLLSKESMPGIYFLFTFFLNVVSQKNLRKIVMF